jgi:ABC-2 type transport system ATP-binding protein
MSNTENETFLIEAQNLTKLYGDFIAVNDLTFACRRGEVVGFLGPNGAGKTTTMRMLTGYMPPTSGAAYIAGYHTIQQSIEARQRLGYLPETVPLYPEMTVENYLAFVGRLRQVDNLWERVDDVLEAVDMLDRAETYIGRLSKGMRQRIGLAQALMHDPDVLILDEPTIGLDPAQIREVRELISEVGKKHTILLSTHILSEVEQICSRVIMVFNGSIRADMSIDEIRKGDEAQTLNLKLAQPSPLTEEQLATLDGVESVEAIGKKEFQLIFDGRDDTRTAVADMAVKAGWGLLELSTSRQTLETIFLNKLREAEQDESLSSQYVSDDETETVESITAETLTDYEEEE